MKLVALYPEGKKRIDPLINKKMKSVKIYYKFKIVIDNEYWTK